MKRREILRGLGLGIGGAAMPAWIAASFDLDREPTHDLCDGEPTGPGDTPAPAPAPTCSNGQETSAPREDTSGAAAGTQSAVPRPRLVLLIPGDREERWLRGRAFGEFLNHGAERDLASLAPLEVCAWTVDELRERAGVKVRGEPWLVLLPAEAPTTAKSKKTGQRAKPRIVKTIAGINEGERDAWPRPDQATAEAAITRRIARVGAAITDLVDRPLLEHLSAAESASLSPALASELRDVLDFALSPRNEVVAAASATLLAELLATDGPADKRPHGYLAEMRRSVLLPRLAELTRDRLVRSRPPEGARWANAGGCGIRVEGSRSNVAIGCGMGHVPERSRRFLSFLNDHDRGF